MKRCLMTTFLFVLVLSAGVAAQEPGDTVMSLPGVEITTSVDLSEMYIGDLITYTLSITYDSTVELIPPPLGANLGAFDVKDYEPDVETKLDDGRIRSETTFKLSTFTTGDYVIPPVPIFFVMPDSSRKIVLSESVPIKVLSLLESAGADTVDVRPLKPPYEFERTFWAQYRWYLIGAAGLIIVLVLVWFFFMRKKPREEIVDLRPPWEIAFEKLAMLKEAHHLEEERYKEYYFALTELARYYLGRMYEVDALEMTTEEFVQCFSDIDLPEGMYGQSIDFLQHADLVKFARLTPEHTRAENDYLYVHEMIEVVRDDIQRRREAEMRIADETPAPIEGGGQ